MIVEEFRLPDLGEGLPEAELVQWMVREGDTVTLNQTIAEVETAKAIVELPSPHAGIVRSLHAAAGDVIEVGSVFISFELGGENETVSPAATEVAGVTDGAGEGAAMSEGATAAQDPPNLVGYGAAPRATIRPQRRARTAPAGRGGADTSADTALRAAAPRDVLHEMKSVPVSGEQLRERPRSTPPVRKLAKDLGVELALVEPTALTGIISRGDVETYARRVQGGPGHRDDAGTGSSAASAVSQRRTTRSPIRGVRKHTAAAMLQSAFSAPHVTIFLTVDITATSELIASLKGDRALDGHRIAVLALAAKAVCLALVAHPSLNSRWDAANDEIVEHHYVNLGIAAATPRGLVVPNIRDAETLTLIELADAIGELAQTARAGKTASAQMSGGTFSITNVGVFGVDAGTPILNPGEAGILALGAVRSQPWEYRGEIALRDVMTLSLSFDHRLVDGEQGARFLRDVAAVLREPGRAMLLR